MKKRKLSFVIPCYCSQNTLSYVVEDIQNVMAERDEQYEVVLVNDGSPDNTGEVISELSKKYSNIVGIQLTRNFGQAQAQIAGFHFCTGDVIVSLDDDGETPASEIGKLLDKLEEGYDVVFARYVHNQHSAFRILGSRVNAMMASSLLDMDRNLFISSYYVIRRFVVEEIIKYKHPYPYPLGIMLHVTTKIANVDVTHCNRIAGQSGYNFHKLFAFWLNGVTAFSVKPLRVASVVGMTCSIVGFLYSAFIIMQKLFVPEIAIGWSSVMATILLVSGVIMMMLGMIGEYVGRTYVCQNNVPQFVVREVVGHGRDDLTDGSAKP